MRIQTIIRTAALAGVFALAPVAVSPQKGLAVSNACASKGCCLNERAICDLSALKAFGYENKSVIQKIIGC